MNEDRPDRRRLAGRLRLLSRAGAALILLSGCGGPEAARVPGPGPGAELTPGDGVSRPMHPLPYACQLQRGGGILQDGMVIVAGLLMEGGCEGYEEGTEWERAGPWLGPPPAVLVATDSEILPPGPWVGEEGGPVAFAFPVSLEGDRWGMAWGQAIEGTAFERGSTLGAGWPAWRASRFWISEFSEGRWMEPRLVDSAEMSFLAPMVSRQVTLTADGSSVLLVEETPTGHVGDIRLWSERGGLTAISFDPSTVAFAVSPVLAVDSKGSHWIAWLEERTDLGSPGHAFMVREIGPEGTERHEPTEIPISLASGVRVTDLTLVFDTFDRPHLLWVNGIMAPHFSHVAAVGTDGSWEAFPVRSPSGGDRVGITGTFLAGAGPDGGLYVHEGTFSPLASDGNFGNVNIWAWSEEGWEFQGVDAGPERADLDIQSVLRPAGDTAFPFPVAIWSSMEVPPSLDPDQIPQSGLQRFLHLHIPNR